MGSSGKIKPNSQSNKIYVLENIFARAHKVCVSLKAGCLHLVRRERLEFSTTVQYDKALILLHA